MSIQEPGPSFADIGIVATRNSYPETNEEDLQRHIKMNAWTRCGVSANCHSPGNNGVYTPPAILKRTTQHPIGPVAWTCRSDGKFAICHRKGYAKPAACKEQTGNEQGIDNGTKD